MAKETKKEEPKVEEPKKEAPKKSRGFSVDEVQELKPVERPLIVTPDSGEWANDSQAYYASVLNSYAYSNPEKWATKKEQLLNELEELGKDPGALGKYAGFQPGSDSRLEYKDHRFNKLGD